MQVYVRPKKNLLGSSLAFNLKEGPVRCAKVCDKSWVILGIILVKTNFFVRFLEEIKDTKNHFEII